jgi:hypothetical protein
MNAIDLRSLPVSARRSLVSRLPAETQRELWRAHLAHIATRAGDASLERRIAINALDYLPRLFDSEIAVTHRAALARQLWTEAASALGRERSADIFFALGSRDAVSRASQFDPKYPQVALAVFEGEPLQQAFASFASGIALCVCSTYYQDCTSAPECTESSNPHCGHTEQGCGPMWLAACDGSCNS